MLESVLAGLPSLRRLYLQQNYSIAGDGARALAAVLTASSSLEVRVMAWGGGEPVAGMLAKQGNCACSPSHHCGGFVAQEQPGRDTGRVTIRADAAHQRNW